MLILPQDGVKLVSKMFNIATKSDKKLKLADI